MGDCSPTELCLEKWKRSDTAVKQRSKKISHTLLLIIIVFLFLLPGSRFFWSCTTVVRRTDPLWATCGKIGSHSVECATIEVAVDQFNHSNFAGKTFSIALAQLKGKNASHSLLLNPGGPASSGTKFLFSRGKQLRAIVGDNFDLVAFDPRGVNKSSPEVSCFLSEQQRSSAMLTYSENVYKDTGAVYARSQNLCRSCKDVMGDEGAYLNTPNTAADMNNIIDALGEEKLYYYGFSYGTTLGQTYAQLFPDRVGRLIIDGVSDQGDWYDKDEYATGTIHMTDTDATFNEFLSACLLAGPNCSLSKGFSDANSLREALFRMVDSLEDDPLPVYINSTTWGEVTRMEFLNNVIMSSLYRPVSWPALADSLADALKGNFSSILQQQGLMQAAAISPEALQFIMRNDGAYTKLPSHLSSKEEILQHFLPVGNASIISGASYGRAFFERRFWQYENKHHFEPASDVTTAHPLLILSTTLDRSVRW